MTNEGVCGEMSFVYVTMARCAGLQSYYMHVDRDFRNKKVNHACAYVNVGRDLFVDIAYKMYDIEHRRYKILNDQQIMKQYNNWRKK